MQAGKKEAEVTAAVPEPAAGEASGMKKEKRTGWCPRLPRLCDGVPDAKITEVLKDSGIRYEEIPM